MKPLLSAWVVVALFAFNTTSCLAAATLTQKIDPPEVNVGDQAIVTITVQNGSVDNLNLPQVDGLDVVGTQSATNITFSNGSLSRAMSINFAVAPSRAGTFTIPAFDIHTQEGDVLHVKAMKLHVVDNGASASTNTAPAQTVPAPAPSSSPSANTPFNSNGPVVMPPANANGAGNSSDTTTGNTINVPVESDGRPANVFMVITPDTTDAYVGQAITLRITWYIRQDVDYQQDSLPTIKGSDFLMNDLSYRPHEDEQAIMNEVYRCESWVTSISAPKSGDFPLLMERDSYWIKSIVNNNNLDPFFGGFFNRRPNLAHESISSNQLTIHVHALPTEGRPVNFTGAIGHLKVTGTAEPTSVDVGDPVTLHFSVSGEGNFNYVRCPTLASDPAWKTYVPTFKIDYLGDESHTQAVKTFDQSVIPLKNGNVPLPTASFSYFDPATKQYVTVPIALPEITVTGTPIPLASTAPGSGTNSTTASTTPTAEFLPNRLEIGSPQLSLTPVYRQPWFWAIQGGLVFLTLLGAIFLFLRSRSTPDNDRAARVSRQRSLQQEEDAMAEAVRRDDAVAFFIAARHAVQLELGTQWNLRPEAITLAEIRDRDPHLAEVLEPFFAQADEVIYSGHASSGLDLAQWEHRVRTELLQPQPA